MRLVIEVNEDFVAEEGDAFDAVCSALEHFEIPATVYLWKDYRSSAREELFSILTV